MLCCPVGDAEAVWVFGSAQKPSDQGTDGSKPVRCSGWQPPGTGGGCTRGRWGPTTGDVSKPVLSWEAIALASSTCLQTCFSVAIETGHTFCNAVHPFCVYSCSLSSPLRPSPQLHHSCSLYQSLFPLGISCLPSAPGALLDLAPSSTPHSPPTLLHSALMVLMQENTTVQVPSKPFERDANIKDVGIPNTEGAGDPALQHR